MRRCGLWQYECGVAHPAQGRAVTRSESHASGRIELRDDDGYSTLLCPRCGGDNLHHLGVVVFDCSEDAKVLTRTEVNAGLVASHLVPADPSGNPSSRRHGMVISFCCETCNARPIELRIAQHKGNTHVDWRYVAHQPEKDPP